MIKYKNKLNACLLSLSKTKSKTIKNMFIIFHWNKINMNMKLKYYVIIQFI